MNNMNSLNGTLIPTRYSLNNMNNNLPTVPGFPGDFGPIPTIALPPIQPTFGTTPASREIHYTAFNPHYLIHFQFQEILQQQGCDAALEFYNTIIQRDPSYENFIPEIKTKDLYCAIYRTQLKICQFVLTCLNEECLGRPSLFNEYRGLSREFNKLETLINHPFNIDALYCPTGEIAQATNQPSIETPQEGITAAFLPENDIDYLKDVAAWKRRLSLYLNPEEIRDPVLAKIDVLLEDLQDEQKLDRIMENLFSRGAEHTYLSGVILPPMDFNQRKDLESCFVATVLRHHVIKKEQSPSECALARETFRDRLSSDYGSFMNEAENGQINDNEITWLHRFERAVLLAKSYIEAKRNKGLFLSVANLLEGSDDLTRYITGSHTSRETKRRVLLIEHNCDVKPRKRTRKLMSAPMYMSSTMSISPMSALNLSMTIANKIKQHQFQAHYFQYKEAFARGDHQHAESINATIRRETPGFESLCNNKLEYKKFAALQLELSEFELESSKIELLSLKAKLVESPVIVTAYKTMGKQIEIISSYQQQLKDYLSEMEDENVRQGVEVMEV